MSWAVRAPYLSEYHGDEEGEEDPLVALADAIAYGRAMVIEPTDTLVAHLQGSFRSSFDPELHTSLTPKRSKSATLSHLAVL